MVDIGLESIWCVRQPKRHDSVLQIPILSAELSFLLVAFLEYDKVIGVPEVQFHEDPGSSQSVDHVRDQRDMVSVLHGGCVESLGVQTEPQSAVHLLSKHDWRSCSRR